MYNSTMNIPKTILEMEPQKKVDHNSLDKEKPKEVGMEKQLEVTGSIHAVEQGKQENSKINKLQTVFKMGPQKTGNHIIQRPFGKVNHHVLDKENSNMAEMEKPHQVNGMIDAVEKGKQENSKINKLKTVFEMGPQKTGNHIIQHPFGKVNHHVLDKENSNMAGMVKPHQVNGMIDAVEKGKQENQNIGITKPLLEMGPQKKGHHENQPPFDKVNHHVLDKENSNMAGMVTPHQVNGMIDAVQQSKIKYKENSNAEEQGEQQKKKTHKQVIFAVVSVVSISASILLFVFGRNVFFMIIVGCVVFSFGFVSFCIAICKRRQDS